MLIKTSRRALLTGAAALAAYSAIGHNGGPPLLDDAEAASLYRRTLDPYTIMGSGQIAAWWSSKDYNLRMTDAGSGKISNWVDRITGLAVTATSTAEPTWTANSGYPYIAFDGVANCFVNTSFAALPTGSTPGSIFCVSGGITTPSGVVSAVVYGATTGGAVVRQIAMPSGGLSRVTDGATNLVGTNLVGAGLQILYGDWSGTVENGFQNGVAFAGNPGTIATLATGTTRMRFGAGVASVAAGFWPGNIYDVLITNVVPSTLQRQQLEGFFAWTRQAPVNGVASILQTTHPYYGARP